MEVALGQIDYKKYFNTDSPLQAYQAYWKFDGGWEALFGYVSEKLGAPVGPIDLEHIEAEGDRASAIADRLRLDAAGEAVQAAQRNPNARYGVEDACVVRYDDVADTYVLLDALGMECTYFTELLVDINEVVRELASIWWEYEG